MAPLIWDDSLGATGRVALGQEGVLSFTSLVGQSTEAGRLEGT